MRKYISRYYMPILWMGVIFIVSAQSTLPQAGEGMWDVFIKKTGHVTEYAILGWLWWRSLRIPQRVTRNPEGWAWVLSTLYALTDEFHQSLVPLRHPKFTDVIIDSLGALCILIWLWWWRRWRRGVD